MEAIYVATPNTLHYENCKLCLEQGKHVLCEKPFTISPEQAQQLYHMAEEKHLFLMEAFWIWLLPLYDRLREIRLLAPSGLKQITCQYGIASVPGRIARFDSGLGGRCAAGYRHLQSGLHPYGQDRKGQTKEVHINVSTAPMITAALR